MFYLNTIKQLFLFVAQLDQLEVCLPYSIPKFKVEFNNKTSVRANKIHSRRREDRNRNINIVTSELCMCINLNTITIENLFNKKITSRLFSETPSLYTN